MLGRRISTAQRLGTKGVSGEIKRANTYDDEMTAFLDCHAHAQ